MDTNAHNTVTGNGERVLTVSRKAKGIFWDPLFWKFCFIYGVSEAMCLPDVFRQIQMAVNCTSSLCQCFLKIKKSYAGAVSTNNVHGLNQLADGTKFKYRKNKFLYHV